MNPYYATKRYCSDHIESECISLVRKGLLSAQVTDHDTADQMANSIKGDDWYFTFHENSWWLIKDELDHIHEF